MGQQEGTPEDRRFCSAFAAAETGKWNAQRGSRTPSSCCHSELCYVHPQEGRDWALRDWATLVKCVEGSCVDHKSGQIINLMRLGAKAGTAAESQAHQECRQEG